MPVYRTPRSYADANAMIDQRDRTNIADGIGLARTRDAIVVYFDGEPRVRFYRDGRIGIVTYGHNTRTESRRVNACLPEPYRVRARGAYLTLMRGHRLLATFLSSTTFRPESSATDGAPAAGYADTPADDRLDDLPQVRLGTIKGAA